MSLDLLNSTKILTLQVQDLETKENTLHYLDLSAATLSHQRNKAVLQTQECSIGRANTCGIKLSKLSVSRQHGKIHSDGQNYYYTDLGSMSGSYLNGVKMTPHKSEQLYSDSKILINEFVLLVKDIATQSEPNLETDDLPTQFLLPEEPGANARDYMPVAHIKPSKFDRWEKGELTVKCVRVIEETADAKTFRFVAEPPVLFSYQPGQFVTLNLEINGQPASRSYSISSTPSRPHTLEITVKRVPPASPNLPQGLVSNWLHDNLQVGDRIKLNGPMGKFTCFAHSAPKLLFLSAGSGITPMMAMSRWIYDTGADCDVFFFHSTRLASDVIFRDELDLMAKRQNNFHLAISYTGIASGGLKGRLTPEMLAVICPDFSDRTVFVCGPKGFMDSMKQMLVDLEFPMENYHQESFGSPKKKVHHKVAANSQRFGIAAFLDQIQPQALSTTSVVVPAAPEKSQPQVSIPAQEGILKLAESIQEGNILEVVESINIGDYHLGALANSGSIASPPPAPPQLIPSSTSIQVVFENSGVEVASDGEESILELAEQAGVKIRSGCRMGSCGACKKSTRSGKVKMSSPDALEPSEIEAGYVLCCIAYPQDRVVVEA
jgi:glycine betaine catabolism B